MRGIEQLISILRKYKFSDIRLTLLERSKAKTNRADVKSFAYKVEERLSRFQDSDVILLALTVQHTAVGSTSLNVSVDQIGR